MNTSKDFNAVAQTWDEKPQRIHLAAAVSATIQNKITLNNNMAALEFGCGTGLVTFHLVSLLKQVTLVDNAAAMLEVVQQKAQALKVDNIEVIHNPDAVPCLPVASYDLIYSSMVLHHIRDIVPVLKALIVALKPGGIIALADLDAEDGSFHGDPKGVEHYGIERDFIIDLLQQCSMQSVQQATAHTIVKQQQGGERSYPVFLVWAQKPI